MSVDIRRARRDDVPAIVALLADDDISVTRGAMAAVDAGHFQAFDAIASTRTNCSGWPTTTASWSAPCS